MEAVDKLNNKRVKLVYHDLGGHLASESIWVTKDGKYYRVKNIPFFAPNLAFNDLVSVEDYKGELFFESLIEPSGHSTIQIVFLDFKYFKEITDKLLYFNCSWEGCHLKEYIGVDVPYDVNYQKVHRYLKNMLKRNIIDFKEACLGSKSK